MDQAQGAGRVVLEFVRHTASTRGPGMQTKREREGNVEVDTCSYTRSRIFGLLLTIPYLLGVSLLHMLLHE